MPQKEREVFYMYNNAGSKVKTLAKTIAIVLMVLSVLGGIGTMIAGSFIAGLLAAALGCLGAWLSGLTLAAFGELVENSNKIVKALGADAPKGRPAAPAAYQQAPAGYQPRPAAPQQRPAAAQVCRVCGAPRKSSSPFCGSCGAKMD